VIDWDLLIVQIIDASVVAVNATAFNVAERAKAKAPVRKVFRGGRQTVRFKTASEIGADRAMRAALGLAPEILATPAALAAVKKSGRNPGKSTRIGGEEFGFARVVTHRNRANTFMPGGVLRREDTEHKGMRRKFVSDDLRLMNPKDATGTSLASPMAERELTARGRYELKSGRAVSEKTELRVDLQTGRLRLAQTEQARLGGSLRSSIRVEKANRGQFPIIKASVVAGGGKVTYAKYQELGTRHNPAHPFLRPALAGARDELPAQLRRAFGRLGR
jgi:HK97 gp10 family phage protein